MNLTSVETSKHYHIYNCGINGKNLFKENILYIHNNHVRHGFSDQAMEYSWSSYLICISVKPTKLQGDAVVGWFNKKAKFKYRLEPGIEVVEIEKFLRIY